MASFKDKFDRDWVLSLDAPAIRAVQQEFQGVNLADPEGKVFEALAADPCLLVDVLWVLCREQSQAAGLTEPQFAKALVGDTIEAATDALLAAITDFFPRRKRDLLTAVTAKNQKLRELATVEALAKINNPALETQILESLAAQMDEQIRQVLTRSASATASPDLSASIPAG